MPAQEFYNLKCRRCSECKGQEHHWIENDAFVDRRDRGELREGGMIENWLTRVLAQHAYLDLWHPEAQAKLAEKILAALPLAVIEQAASSAVSAQAAREIVDVHRIERIATQAGRSAAQSIALALEEAP